MAAAVALLVGGLLVRLGPPAGANGHGRRLWVASWAAAPQAANPPNWTALTGFADRTLREVVFPTVAGTAVEVRFTNRFGKRPLEIGAAVIGAARPLGAVGAQKRLTFAGRTSVVIAPGAEALSDSVRLSVVPLHDLAISVFLPRATGPATTHTQAEQMSYGAPGDHVFDRGGRAFARHLSSWYFLDAVDVLAPPRVLGAVVALGDSITEGVGSRLDANGRWPDDLARRLDARPGRTLAVLDEGIGGNRVLRGSPCYGPSAIARFHTDIAAQTAARVVILLEGTNDIGMSQSAGPCASPRSDISAREIIQGDEQIIAQAHTAGLKIIGATIPPFRGAGYWTPTGEARREAINHWIRTSAAFDATVDFARALADPLDPTRLDPRYDSGDHLHPDEAGYRAMAGAVDLATLLHAAGGRSAARGRPG